MGGKNVCACPIRAQVHTCFHVSEHDTILTMSKQRKASFFLPRFAPVFIWTSSSVGTHMSTCVIKSKHSQHSKPRPYNRI